ncbi:MAG: amidohydrolase [Cryomorphaceae bacterium]|nr:amidohydrolase [Cryomorphaceae bacterium]
MKPSFLSITIIALLFQSCMPKEQADVLFYNAMFYTVDASFGVADAMVIRDGLVLELGPEQRLRKKYTSQHERDLKGNYVYPGFVDAHAHFLALARSYQEVDLRRSFSAYDMVVKVSDFQLDRNYSVIRGMGWDQNLWEDNEMPDNTLLSKLFPETPVLLRRIDGHAMLVNDIVLERNGITANTKIEGGEVVTVNGVCTGVLIDNAMELVKWPGKSLADLGDGVKLAQRKCFSLGLTGLSEMGLSWEEIQFMDSLYVNDVLQMNMQVLAGSDSVTFEKALASGGWITKGMELNGFKFYADGALGSRGACLIKPYSDLPESHGFLLKSPAALYEASLRVKNAGMQLCTHAIGDSANRVMLDIYKGLWPEDTTHRWRIEHAQVVNDDDIKSFVGTGIIPSVQPTHATSDMLWAVNRLGVQRLKDAYRYEDLRKAAGLVALGTDFPIEPVNPLGTFFSSVVRKNDEGVPDEGFQMNNALSRMHTLQGMTIWAAYAQFADDRFGSLEPGKQADFVVLDIDLMDASEEDLRRVEVQQTYIKGRNVYGVF